MSLGKMNKVIEIVSSASEKDAEGFAIPADTVLATVRAYVEPKNGTEKWANNAAFEAGTALFRFRKVPALTVTAAMSIVCGGEKYNVVSAQDVKGRGMYVEALAERVAPSEK